MFSWAKLEKEKVNIEDAAARKEYLQQLFQTIQDAKGQCQDIKYEYEDVTAHLKDIQLLDQAPEEEKTELLAAAAQIVECNRERQRLQKRKYKLTDPQKQVMERYEDTVQKDIGKLTEYESYQLKIKNDLRQLGGEKELLLQDKTDIIRRQHMLKTIGKALSIILVALGAMLLALVLCFKVDITFPFLATVVFAAAVAGLILNEARKNRIDMAITEKKCNRAISLTNRVKIKYVNNVKTLDYLYSKYQVRNVAELEYVYGQYCLAKREWALQRETMKKIYDNNQILVAELHRLGVKDTSVWLSQAIALVEPKELVEVRHELNENRQKLREQLDYNTDIMEDCLVKMEKIRDMNSDYEREVEQILSQGI